MTDQATVRTPMDDLVQPFQIEASRLRGRMVRLGPELDDILNRHAYPEPVARFLAETLALAVLLSSMLKYEGVFTLQTKGDGPISLMVADVTSVGDLRAYAQFDEEALRKAGDDVDIAPAPALLGKGYIAFTVDQGADTDRYQGIVELSGKTLADCVQHYFRQSEQIDTGVTVGVGRDEAGGWRAGAIMMQRLPPDQGPAAVLASDTEDDWRRAMVMLTSVTTEELLNPELGASTLLYRLFHEDGVRVWPPQALRFGCRCSRERVETMLASLPREEVQDLKVDGVVEVVCQFCSTAYRFDDAELERVYGGV
ncbi:Hsp33 family molecular chaperone [Azospirillum sp. RWY-5-1]|uniref:Hsp33 family molecular chaperone n=1 Tax=Azospirillum oleiclasticum TaxID=2735135 RepID=A0ABX2TLI5_9PROT|nr:Hsp33 family molecular chaperone [Azospirillum oleiclasticum]NYZ16027.1 Hsp33 family molecular chaperone [Azospirillum oleiclasticum]NYZ23495.1 Hsp33 family molecular chaperone [Azospirillum oleiclasticum]